MPIRVPRAFVLIVALLAVVSGLVRSEPGAAAPGDLSWRPLARTFTPRAGAGAAMVGGQVYLIGGHSLDVASGDGYLGTNERYDPATRVWATRASMPTTRWRHGVAALPNGHIYAVGGRRVSGGTESALVTVERYDPTQDTWTARASLATARDGLGLAALGGRLYAAGGGGATCCSAVLEEYDPTADLWRTRAPLATARTGLGLAAASGRLFAIGGTNGNTTFYSFVEEYDPTANTWTARGAMPTARAHVATATAANGRIYVAGGQGATSSALATLEEFDPVAGAWSTRRAMPVPRSRASLVAAPSGRLYLLGGVSASGAYVTTVDEYDPVTDSWTTWRSLPTPRVDLALARAGNGRVYAIGGWDLQTPLGLVEEFDPATELWTTRGAMPTGRAMLGAAYATNGRVYAIGGVRSQGVTATNEEYNPNTDGWTSRASMPTARSALGVAAHPSGRVYAVGGKNALSADLATVEEYDPATDRWRARAALPSARSGLAVATGQDGRVYAAGGLGLSGGAGGYLATVEAYDPADDGWVAVPSLSVARTNLALVATDDGRLYAIGGENADGPLATVEELDLSRIDEGWQLRQPLPTARYGHAAAVATSGRLYAVGGRDGTRILADADEGTVEPPAGSPPTATPSPTPTPTVPADPWPQFGHDPRHSGLSRSRVPGAAELRWRYHALGPVTHGPVVGPDGTVYTNASGQVLAIAPDGNLRWRRKVADGPGTLAVGSDGTIFAAGGNLGEAVLEALRPDGSALWRVALVSDPEAVPEPSLAIGPDGTVYIGVKEGSETAFYSYTPSGVAGWTAPTITGLSIAPAPAVGSDGTLYVGTYAADGRVEAISRAGTPIGRSEPLGYISGSPSIGPDGTIYVGSSRGVHALTPQGLVRWTHRTDAPVTYSTPAVAADGTVYVGVGDRLYALTPNGVLKWRSHVCLRGGVISSSPAIGADGGVVFQQLRTGTDVSAALCSVDSAGMPRWLIETQGRAENGPQASSPAIGGDGLVYVGSPDGHVYAVGGPVFEGLTRRVLLPAGPRRAGLGD